MRYRHNEETGLFLKQGESNQSGLPSCCVLNQHATQTSIFSCSSKANKSNVSFKIVSKSLSYTSVLCNPITHAHQISGDSNFYLFLMSLQIRDPEMKHFFLHSIFSVLLLTNITPLFLYQGTELNSPGNNITIKSLSNLLWLLVTSQFIPLAFLRSGVCTTGGSLQWNANRLQNLCRSCYDEKTKLQSLIILHKGIKITLWVIFMTDYADVLSHISVEKEKTTTPPQ